jgi:signal transduction histidine kinase/ligand-binding sensor domain-containing protein
MRTFSAMVGGPARKRFSHARLVTWCVLAFALALGLLWSTPCRAKETVQRLSQHGHTTWRTQDGLFNGPNGLVQTTDGYLWIGTSAGLMRFDGVRFVPWNTFPGLSIDGWNIESILATADGSLWIAGRESVVQLKGGRATRYESPGRVTALMEDDAGVLWLTKNRVNGRGGPLCKLADSKFTCYGKPELPIVNAAALHVSKRHGIWVGSVSTLCQWSTENTARCFPQTQLKSSEGLLGVTSILSARDGTMWVGIAKAGTNLGLGQFADGRFKPYVVPGFDGSSLSVTSLMEDRAGSLWVGTLDQGVVRIHKGQVERFSSAQGLSSNAVAVGGLFEDREGTIWVATSAGLDAFRRLPVSVFSMKEGLLSEGVESVLPARDGTVWVGNFVLSTLVDDRVLPPLMPTLFGTRAVTSLLEDHDGRIWVGLDNTLNVFEKGKLKPIVTPDGADLGVIEKILEDSEKNVWAVTARESRRVFRIRDFVVKEEVAPATLGNPSVFARDPSGGLWLGYKNGDIASYRSGELKTWAADTVSNGDVRNLLAEPNGTVLATTSRGLLIQRGSSRQLLGAPNGLPCGSIIGLLRDANAALWLTSRCGIIQITNDALEHWFANPSAMVVSRTFDVTDGAQPGVASFTPAAKMGPDGRLWFANSQVIQVIDPGAIERRNTPPAVYIEELNADRARVALGGLVRLPSRTRDIDIRYTALSFVVPQKIKFQYRLEGRDDAWQDAGTRRQAFYTDLPPGRYRFRVKASNSDGVWNEEGAAFDFEIVPALYQTTWFAALCAVLFGAATYGLYVARLRQVAYRIRERLSAKNSERERIARDLHDTLLQSTQGLILRFQAATNEIAKDNPTRQTLELALDRADEVLAEGRDRVMDLRVAADSLRDLPQAFASAGQTLAQGGSITFRTTVEGQPRELLRRVKDEVYSIGREALINAFRHANANAIEVQLIYADNDFSIRIRDDGVGIDASALQAGSRLGHWGLPGMRERAKDIDAQLNVWSRAGAGTEIELKIPSAVAHGPRSRAGRWLQRWRLGTPLR